MNKYICPDCGARAHSYVCGEPEPEAGIIPGMTVEERMDLMLGRPEAMRNLGRYEGAAVAFGLMGMAFAIQDLQRYKDYQDRILEADMGS